VRYDQTVALPPEAEKRARDSVADELQRIRQLAKLAHELKCEITLGPYTVRPIVETSPTGSLHAALASLKAPILSFFDKL